MTGLVQTWNAPKIQHYVLAIDMYTVISIVVKIKMSVTNSEAQTSVRPVGFQV